MGQHWYSQQGQPCHTMVGANGKERDVTIKDAKKMKLLPSVTGIIGQIDKPSLTQWKLKQLLVSVHHCPVSQDHEEFDDIVWDKFKTTTEQFSKDGTEIHNLLETFYKTGFLYDKEEFLIPVINKIQSLYPTYTTITSEYNFAVPDGYAGQIDLVLYNKKDHIIIDFKTKQGDQQTLNKFKPYSSYAMQLAAYRRALCDVSKCINVFISTTDPGAVMVHEWEEDELKHEWEKFKCLYKYWVLDKNYDPSFEVSL